MKRSRVLVIDDDRNATRVSRLILERTGHYEVRELNDPKRALPAAREFAPHLILLDVCMPNIEGGKVAETIGSDPTLGATPIVFLTCIVTPAEAGNSGTVIIGRHEYIAKPVRPETLIACVERNLEHSHRLPQSAEYAYGR